MKGLLCAIILLAVSLISYGQTDLQKGLVAYYPFNGNAYDESGNSNDPSLAKVSFTADRFGNPNSACSFNGKNNYIRIPDHPSLNFRSSFTISAWIMVKGFYEGKCHGNRIIMKGYSDVDTGNYLLTFDDNHYTNGNNCASSRVDKQHQAFYAPYTKPLPGKYVIKDKWNLLTLTYDGNEIILYVDCEISAKGIVSDHYFSNDEDLFFGKLDNQNYPYWFNGLLDEVRFYNRVLTKEEIRALCDQKQ
jgi:hypothetical protein